MTQGFISRDGDYRPLFDWLVACEGTEQALSPADIQSILGFELPSTAWLDTDWWASVPRRVHARSWLRADYAAALNVDDCTVVFRPVVFSRAVTPASQLDQRAREVAYARGVLKWPADLQNVERGWWEPHRVYVLHLTGEPLYKVGLTIATSRRLRDLTARGRATIEMSITVANRWAALLVESAVLDATEHARAFADPFNSQNGQTEHWHDSTPPPALESIVHELADDTELLGWKLSQSRPANDVH